MIQVDKQKCTLCGRCVTACPFNAIELREGEVLVNSGCKLCRLCLKSCPSGAMSLGEAARKKADKTLYRGIMVYVEHYRGEIHPVTYELLGKAQGLAEAAGDEVCCLFVGSGISGAARGLVAYGAKKVFVYDAPELCDFRVDNYANVFADCIARERPSVVLVGATATGRSLAPRVAARFKTGLTADCTKLERRANSDLVQIRPAFGGNIMAQILTANSRPQFATVRYKVMEQARPDASLKGEVVLCASGPELLRSGIEILEIHRRPRELAITDAEVLVAAGRGVKEETLPMLKELAGLLGGQLAGTRPMVEAGLLHYTRQIGLSGRTVKPKLIITCGVSGAVQFAAGMNSADYIIAIDRDRTAPIFRIAHLGLVGDLCEVIPMLIEKIRGEAQGNGA